MTCLRENLVLSDSCLVKYAALFGFSCFPVIEFITCLTKFMSIILYKNAVFCQINDPFFARSEEPTAGYRDEKIIIRKQSAIWLFKI